MFENKKKARFFNLQFNLLQIQEVYNNKHDFTSMYKLFDVVIRIYVRAGN